MEFENLVFPIMSTRENICLIAADARISFQFLVGDVPRSTSYRVYIPQLIRFARASSHVVDFNTRNKLLTHELLKQGYRYRKLLKTDDTTSGESRVLKHF